MDKIEPTALLGVAMAVAAGPASALQTIVTKVDKNSDGTMTDRIAVKLDKGETLSPGDAKVKPDVVTI